MQRLRILGIALVAIFALSAIVSATASAEFPEILPVPTPTAPLTFTSETVGGSKPILETTKGVKIECAKATNKGEFTSQDLGTATIDFEGCESKGAKCKAEGDVNGTILLKTDIDLVDFKKGAELLLGLEILPLEGGTNKLIITCGILKVEVKGSVIGRVHVKSLEKTKHATVLFTQTKGEQDIKECELLKAFCAGVKFLLEANFGAGFELAGELAEVLVLFPKEIEVHF